MFKRQKYSTTTFSVEADFSEPLAMLERLGANRARVMRRLLGTVGTAAKNEVRRAYKGYGLNKGTGNLYRSITRRVIRSGKAVIVEAKAQSPTNDVFYGYALTKGAEITAKSGRYLTFQIDGKWVKVHSVKLESRDFVGEPVKRYLASAAFSAKLEQLVQKELDRLEKEKSR